VRHPQLAQSLGWTHFGIGRLSHRSPEYWRNRAEEVRAIADGMSTSEEIRTMQEIAVQYDELAKRSECLAAIYPVVKWMDEPP
jgi:hypothetical protein